MNFLETLICLSLIGLLSALSIFGYQSLIVKTRVHSDAQVIRTALNDARNHGGEVSCQQSHCISNEKVFTLSGLNLIETHTFPNSAGNKFVFTKQGLTAFHNGTITITPPDHPDMAKSVVVSQGGRITIK
jgi:Tfp pilus assembly protein FimT